MSATDHQLLCEFIAERSQPAFTALVRQHLDLVYSAALRQVRSPQLAEEVAQSVFADLAAQAHRLSPDTILLAWLYQVTRRTAIDVVRRESRRQARERLAVEMAAMNTTAADWERFEPLLDEAVSSLAESDRAALVLRYFKNQSLRDVGAAFGISDDAAQKRVTRAVDQLRDFFSRQGVTLSAGAVVLGLSAHAVSAAPVALLELISTTTALGSLSAKGTASLVSATKTIAMTTAQKTVLAAAFVLTLGIGAFELKQNGSLRRELISERATHDELAARLAQLSSERDQATNHLALLASRSASANSNNAELLRLRAEITKLRDQTRQPNDLSAQAADAWLNRVKSLKDKLGQQAWSIVPEANRLTEDDWLNAAHSKLDSEKDFRRAFANLRAASDAEVAQTLHHALDKYSAENGKQFPTDLSQLQPYFASPMDAAALDRWGIVPQSEVPNMRFGSPGIILQKTAIDEDYDVRDFIGVGSYGSSSGSGSWHPQDGALLENLMKAYAASHNGDLTHDPALLNDYATTDEQKAAVGRAIKQRQSLTSD